jgi:hypothetical protein
MSLELAEQSIQLLTCHISRWRLCHRSPQDSQSKSWKKCDLCFFFHWSLLRPLAPAEQSIQLFIGAEQQLLLYYTINLKLGHCYLKTINLNLGRRCGPKKTEIVRQWSLLMLLELAEQSIQLLKCLISRWRLCHRSPPDFQSKSWKKVWSLIFLSLITSHAISTSRAEHTTS